MTATRDEVLAVASAQKLVLWTLLTSILIGVASQAISIGLQQQQLDRQAMLVVGLAIMAVGFGLIVIQIIAVVRLCLALHEGWATIIYVILQFVPCLSLIMLLFLNGRATAFLKNNGVRVGLMGASRADLDRFAQLGDRTCVGCGEPLSLDDTRCPVCGLDTTR
jgi:hypothetical protein